MPRKRTRTSLPDALGQAVRETRERRGLSQTELGSAAGLHRNHIGAIERAEINPGFRVIARIASVLNVPLSELIELAESRYREMRILRARELQRDARQPAASARR